MPSLIQPTHFANSLFMLLNKTFDNVQGFFLDKGTYMFETIGAGRLCAS